MAPHRPLDRHLRRIAIAAAFVAIATPSVAQLERHSGFEPPDLLELNGHIGKPFADETGGWNLKLGVGFSPTIYHYHLSVMRVLNSGHLSDNILFAVEPYQPNFYLFASDADLAKIAAATPQELLRITGYRRLGSRNLMVTGVEVGPPPTTRPEATPTR